jgi:hypothetical protein
VTTFYCIQIYVFYVEWLRFTIYWYKSLCGVTIDGRNLIFGHKLHIGTPYRGKRFWTHSVPSSCLPTLLIFIHIVHICSFFVTFFSTTIDGRNLVFGDKLHIGTPYPGKRFWTLSDSYFLFADFVDFYSHLTYICICTIFVAFFSATIDGRNLMFGHKLHTGTPYCGKCFLTRQIPTSCLPKSGGIIGEH